MQNKLLPCPFCGSKAITYFLNGVWIAECNTNNCIGAKISCGYRSEEEAIKHWNTRKPMECIVERLEEEKTEGSGLMNIAHNVAISIAIAIVKGGVDNEE